MPYDDDPTATTEDQSSEALARGEHHFLTHVPADSDDPDRVRAWLQDIADHLANLERVKVDIVPGGPGDDSLHEVQYRFNVIPCGGKKGMYPNEPRPLPAPPGEDDDDPGSGGTEPPDPPDDA